MNAKRGMGLWLLILLLILPGCGGKAGSAPREGVVYLDPNAATAAPAAAVQSTTAPAAQSDARDPEDGAGPEPEEPLDLYFEGKGLRLEPWMEAEGVLSALGDPIGVFEADSCAYIGKDLFYYYPGFELTVNEVDGVNVITAITVADDTVVTPQGLRIYDEEEKLLSLLGGQAEDDVYVYVSGRTELIIQVKPAEDDIRRVATIEYRAADGQ